MRRLWNPIRLLILSFSAILLSTGAGCGNGTTAVPSEQVARTALETALKSWCDGGKPGALPGTEPGSQVHDTPWASGQNLASFEILREETGGVGEAICRAPLARKARTRRGSAVPRARRRAGDGLS